MDPRKKRCTVRGKLVDPKRTDSGAPTDEKLADGQYADHFVLCPEDRAKGYVEPYRESYIHVGRPGPRYPLRDLTAEEEARLNDGVAADDPERIVKYEDYPESERPALGKIWSWGDLEKVGKGCGQLTRMPTPVAASYAAQPGYYGSTFCCGCRAYFPVGRNGEFVWDRETMQRVGTRREA